MKKTIHSDYSDLTQFINDLPTGRFAYSGTTLMQGRNCVKEFTAGGKRIVVKKFKAPNLFNRCAYTCFRGSKAERAYRNALKLKEKGVDTPAPIGYIDIAENGLVKHSYLITEHTDFQPISALIASTDADRLELLDEFVRFTISLHEKGIRHNDYNLSNVLYKRQEDGSCDFMLIDINRMNFGRMGRWACLSNIKRLYTNPDFTYWFSKRYAQMRGWDVYRFVAGTTISRMVFEKQRSRRKTVKRWVKSLAKA